SILANVRNWYIGWMFDRSLDYAVWPLQVRKIVFGGRCGPMPAEFNQPVTKVVWPCSLQQLAFGDSFIQPIEGVVWPASLQQLTFGEDFDQPIE
ncbi:unnamed protein product, partial [Sphacelaria rigidula]